VISKAGIRLDTTALDAKIMPSQGRGTDPVAWACEKGLAVTLGRPLVRVRFAGCQGPTGFQNGSAARF